MGFRDLKIFNRALLAKHLWNLHLKPDSLVARLLKAKYHPHCSILEAKIGWRPSYIWRSLMGAQDLLKRGCRWRIGSVEDVRIWGDKWVPGLENFQVYSYSPYLDWDAKVSELIDQDTRTWRRDMLDLIFSVEEHQAIMAIPLSETIAKDTLCWTGCENGKYTVKSGYFMELEWSAEIDSQHNNNERSEDGLWKKIWRLNIPGKLRVFMWKVAHNILPVGEKISKKVQALGDECLNCGQTETLKHMLVECSLVSRIWSQTPLAKFFFLADGYTCREWLIRVLNEASEEDVGRLCALLWFFWKERNNFLFNNPIMQEWEVFLRADGFIQDFCEVQGNERRDSNHDRRNCSWKKPPLGVFKLNSDAGTNSRGETGLGFIIRDWNGKAVLAATRREEERWATDIAEGRAILFGLKSALEQGIGPLVVESDCKKIIDLIRKREETRTEISNVCNDIKRLGAQLEVRDWSFAYRESNNVAHLLAHLFLSTSREIFGADSIPHSIAAVIAIEATF